MNIKTMFNPEIQSDIIRMIDLECDFEASAQVVGDFYSGYDLRYVRGLTIGTLICKYIYFYNLEMRHISEIFGFEVK